MSDPLLQLISSGLKLWLRSRCTQIGTLELQLKGSGLGLLTGRLAGVHLSAREVCFQGLPLQQVTLDSEAIQLDLQVFKPGKMVALQHPFKVTGSVTFQGTALNQALLTPPWTWLGDWLAEQLMGITPLGSLRLHDDIVELEAPIAGSDSPLQRRFHVNAAQGTVIFVSDSASTPPTALPMDDNIQIKEATVCAGRLVLHGHAQVTPD
ncbi:MAG: DUF2993 domain-containing protein [Synechococcus sp.]